MKKGLCLLLGALALAFIAGPADAQLFKRRFQSPPIVIVQQAPEAKPIAQGEPVQARQLDPKSFAGALQKQIGKLERKTLAEKRIERIINSPDSAKRDRQLDRMERHVRVHLNLSPTAAVDWGADIDWPALLETILELLIALLPLFL